MMRRRVVPIFLFVAVLFAPLLVSADSDLRPSGESYFRQYEEISGSVVGDALRQWQTRARDKYVFGVESAVDFSEWLRGRGALTFDDVVVQPLVSGGESYVEGLGFVRDVDVRYESPLGERAGNFSFGALGSLRESADDVVVWELRGFVGEDDVAGANVGAAYRRLLSDNFLAGVNAFLDYERGGDDLADESFWRWSAGVEATGRHLDFSANRYWALSDAVMATVGGEVFRVYSADGWDAELRGRVAVRYPVAFRFLDSAEVAARYYVWEGDGDAGVGGGDADVSGARYRLGFVPLPQLRFGVEYDDGDGGGKNFGYYVNFRHRLGGASATALSDDGADVWSRRFDPVRREHQQHIVRTQAGAGVVTSHEFFLSSLVVNAEIVTLVPENLSASYTYTVASAEPTGLTALVLVDDGGVVTDNGLVAGGVGGNVVFDLTPVAGGAAVSVSVFFYDLSVAVSNIATDDDDKVRLFFNTLASNSPVLTVSVGGTATSLTYAIESATPSWRGLLSIDGNGVVTYNGGATENGEVVFSVTDDATGAMVLLTVRFGDLVFDDVAVTLTSDDEDSAVLTLMASGGAGGYSYALVSTNPAGASVSLSVNGNALVDAGLAAGGAAMVSAFVSASDSDNFIATATVTVVVLDDVGIAENISITLTPGDLRMPVLTLNATGGDSNYTYALVSVNPSSFSDSLAINGNVVSDSGTASEGPLTVTAVFSATDGIGEMTVSATVAIDVLDVLVVNADALTITLTSDDDRAAVLNLSAMGGTQPYTFAIASSDPSAFANLLGIDSNSGVVSDNGAAVAGAATATVMFSATDAGGSVAMAAVEVAVLDDLVLADDHFTLTLTPADANSAIGNLTASGGDGVYAYRVVSTNPASFMASLMIDGGGVVSDRGAAAAGAVSVTAVFAVADGFGFEVFATVELWIFEALTFVADDLMITVASTDAGAMVLTLTASGGDGSYTYAAASAEPSGWENSLAINANGVITDSGAAANRAATATVFFTATDGNSFVASATVEVIAVADLALAADDITLSVDFGDASIAVLTLTASGGVAPYSYAVVSANPSGLFAIDGSGVVSESGAMSANGSATLVFSVMDSNGMSALATVEVDYTMGSKFSARQSHAAVVFNGRLYVIGGSIGSTRLNDVWSSPNGVNWTQETAAAAFSARSAHSAAVLGGTLYVIGGSTTGSGQQSDVWLTTDGVNWTQQTSAAGFTDRQNFAAAVLDNTLFVMGGHGSGLNIFGDVWSTTDGASWTEETSSFPVRGYFSAAVSGGAIYVSAGAGSGFALLNNVWSSTDGANWSEATADGGFAARWVHSMAALNGSLYVIGGDDNSGSLLNDVWSSADGAANWSQVMPVGSVFSGRQGHSSVAFNGRLWVLGGYNGSNRLDEVWSSADGVTWTQH